MDWNKKVPLRAALCVLAASTSSIAVAAQLINARDVLTQIEVAPGATNAAQSSTAARLLEDIVRFRTQSASMTPKQAASTWFDLYERADTPDRESWRSDHRAYDRVTHAAVGPHTVIAALPPPNTWSALNTEARTRARRAPRDLKALATRLMTELLMQDRRATTATLKEIQAIADRLPPEERDALRANLAELRWTLAGLYGTPEEIAVAFIERVETRGSGVVSQAVDVPDFVELLGEPRATELLQNAFTKPVRLRVKQGDATRALARRVALEQMDTLREPQWALVNSLVDAELYEAMQRRFPAAASAEAAASNRFDSDKTQADTWYFLSLVSAARQDEAEKMLAVIAGNEPLTLARPAIDALQLFGHNEALYTFLHALLAKRPELRVWNMYLEQAAFTGHSADALKLINTLLKRKDLPDYVLTELRYHRANALLADDQVNPAITALRQLLSTPPKREDQTLKIRADAAVRLAAVGRILNRRDVPAVGLTFARQVLELPEGEDEPQSFYREGLLRSVLAEQRKLALLDQAQAVAMAEIRRSASIVDEYQQYGFAPPTQIAAMVELVSIYVSQKRYQDAVTLLDESTKWGARDLATLLHVQDSQDVPFGVLAARALAAGGNLGAARSLTLASIQAHPGNDTTYELLLEIDANPASWLDELYAEDAFEERPLIWKATALHRVGQHEPAQQAIERAITVDPSDGEQGPNNRMRAYLVLAEILDARGDRKTAAAHRNTIDAIRISERADELYQHGLYKRAFAGYREALDHFADAYCIQSRLAVQLNQQGRRKEALDHYRRAYELMPASFGRMESHCFGCENVFQGPEQQSLADRAFQEILARNPQQAQAHYLLGYLRELQGRHADALQLYRQAVSLDSEYLNAWKHLHDLGERIHIDPKERDIARLKLMALDPRQRYVTFDLTEVTDLAGLWRAAAAVQNAAKPKLAAPSLYPLRRSTQVQDESIAKLPEGQRGQFQIWHAAIMQELSVTALTPQQTLMRHKLIKAAARLMGAEPNRVQH